MKKKSLNSIYQLPLPVTVRPLPPLILHNPLSVLYYIWDWAFPTPVARHLYKAQISEDCKFVKVCNEKDMDALWSMGFFGKGVLSRSEPTWFPRTARRLNLEGGDKITAEDITEARRQERKKFKQQRAKAEQEELDRRRALDDPTYQAQTVDDLGVEVEVEAEEVKANVWREEDYEVVEENKLQQIEHLQLSPVEALFLQYGLGVLDVDGQTTPELVEKLSASTPDFLRKYIAYHHYRSKGWCSRSGIKFGTDYLLYKRGPPFAHADFAALVMDPEEQRSWWWYTNIGRVIGGVQKTLVLCYVTVGTGDSLDQILSTSHVREVVYRRWIPSRNRD